MNIFQEVVTTSVPRNHFDLSHDRKFSLNMGELVPCFVQECLPGDSFQVTNEQLVRLQPLVSPMMHRVKVKTEYFFVPNRLLWEGWNEFISSPLDPTNAMPYLTKGVGYPRAGRIGDYLGYPTDSNFSMRINPFPLAGYLKIYNDWYRDQNLIPYEIDYELIDGSNDSNEIADYLDSEPLKRAWGHDYFTSCLPFAQKGEDVLLPLAGSAPVTGTGTVTYDAAGLTVVKKTDGTIKASTDDLWQDNGAIKMSIDTDNVRGNIDNSSNLDVSVAGTADLTSATATTINDLRRAEAVQKWLETKARAGNRYIEAIKGHFGVTSSDARLQRPEFLGGGTSVISVSEVLQTSGTTVDSPQGNMAGHGINVGSGSFKPYFCEEHGFIIGICTVIPDTAYINPTPRWALYKEPLDFAFPEFNHLGEQEVYKVEVDGTDGGFGGTEWQEVFGYIPRYAHYKFAHNTVHGDFKNSLDSWHMARKFTSLPRLNQNFIQANPTSRVFAVTDEAVDKVLVHMFFNVQAKRPFGRYDIPSLV